MFLPAIELVGAAVLGHFALNSRDNAASRRANATGLILSAPNRGEPPGGNLTTQTAAATLQAEAATDEQHQLLAAVAAVALGGYAFYCLGKKA